MAWYDIAPDYSVKSAAGDFMGELVNQVRDNYSPKAIAAAFGESLGKGTVAAAKNDNPLIPPSLILAGGIVLFLIFKRK